MLKKIMALACAGVLCVALSACGGGGPQLPVLALPEKETSEVSGEVSSVSGGEEESAPAFQEVSDKDYEDDLEGLCQYLETNYGVTGEKIEMSYKEIGAIGGYRYQFIFRGSTVQAEFYEFDLKNLNEKGKNCLDSVKEKGFFTVLDNEVPGVLSDNGKYLMIYTDKSTEPESVQQQERVQKMFQEFKK